MNSTETTVTLLNDLGLIKISGVDAKTFLQGQLSCNLDDISLTLSSLGAYLNLQGRIIANFILFEYLDDYYCQLPADVIPSFIMHLKKYARFSKINISDASHSLALLGIHGPNSEMLLKNHFATLPELAWEVVPANDLLLIKNPSEFPRFEIMSTPEKIQKLEVQLRQHESLSTESPYLWHLLDIRAGIPYICAKTQEMFIPQRINYHLLGGLNFEKGCYRGQEVISRLHHRGQLKHHMYRVQLTCDGDLQAGMTVKVKDTVIGTLVDAVEVQTNIWEALCVLGQDEIHHSDVVLENNLAATMKMLDLPYEL